MICKLLEGIILAAGLSVNCKFWSINAAAECLEVKLACNLGVPSEGTPEAGSRIVKLVCLLQKIFILRQETVIIHKIKITLKM